MAQLVGKDLLKSLEHLAVNFIAGFIRIDEDLPPVEECAKMSAIDLLGFRTIRYFR